MTKSQQNDTLGSRLRSERIRIGLTQSEFAEKCGLSKTTQVAYENGQRVPDADYIWRLYDLDVDICYILSGQPAPVFAASSIRWDLINTLMEKIEKWALSRKGETSPALKTQLLEIFYIQFCADGKADENAISKTLALAGKN